MLLQLCGLTVALQNETILSDLSLSVQKGEFLALLGPSGCGKSTLLKSIAGIVPLQQGQVILDGQDITRTPVHKRGTVILFQEMRLFPNMTVLENVKAAFTKDVSYHLLDTLFRTPRFWRTEKELTDKAMDLLAIFNLADKADWKASSLPYGQQRKLEIARALATNMKVLLLDEPAAGMNPTETAELLACINTIRDRFGIAILLIEHDMALVMNVCQRIQVIDYGQTIAAGLPEEIASNPRVIAAYLGE